MINNITIRVNFHTEDYQEDELLYVLKHYVSLLKSREYGVDDLPAPRDAEGEICGEVEVWFEELLGENE